MPYTLTKPFLSLKPYDMLKVKDNEETHRRNKNGVPKRNFEDSARTAMDTNIPNFNGLIQQRRNQNMKHFLYHWFRFFFSFSAICFLVSRYGNIIYILFWIALLGSTLFCIEVSK